MNATINQPLITVFDNPCLIEGHSGERAIERELTGRKDKFRWNLRPTGECLIGVWGIRSAALIPQIS